MPSIPSPISSTPRRRRSIHAVLLLLCLFGLPWWLLGSTAGLRVLAQVAVSFSGGQLQIGTLHGSLLGGLQIESLAWNSPALTPDAPQIEIRQLDWQWQPRALFSRQLLIERLRLASLAIRTAPDTTPAPPPQQLSFDLAPLQRISIEALQVGQFTLSDRAAPGTMLPPLAIDLRLDSDGTVHQLKQLQVRSSATDSPPAAASTASPAWPALQLQAQARLDGRAPFALSADFALEAPAANPPFALHGAAKGDLGRVLLALTASGGLEGGAQLQLAPWAPTLAGRLPELAVDLRGINPAEWLAGAPQARLDVQASLLAAAPDLPEWQGQLRIDNHASGLLETQHLPVSRLEARFTGRDLDSSAPTIVFNHWQVQLMQQGQLRGQGQWQGASKELTLNGSLHAVDLASLASLNTRLVPSRLSGPFQLQAGASRQHLQFTLRETRQQALAMTARLERADGRIAIHSLELRAGEADLQLQGHVDEAGPGEFSLEGRLQQFDPRRFFRQAPSGRINLQLAASGQWQAPIAANARLTLTESGAASGSKKSRLEGQPLTGSASLALTPARLEQLALDLRLGNSRLQANGAWGHAGDQLEIALDAPDLSQWGSSLGLGGALSAAASLGGTPAAPAVALHLAAPRLRLPGDWQLAGLSGAGRLEAEADGQAQFNLVLERLSPPGGVEPLQHLQLTVDGQRTRHTLTLDMQLPGQRQLHLATAGGWTEGFNWAGQLTALQGDGLTPRGAYQLLQAAPLHFSSSAARLENVLLGIVSPPSAGAGAGAGAGAAAAQATRPATLSLQSLSWSVSGGLESRGQLHGLPLAALMPGPSDLRLDGAWDLRLGETLAGSAHLTRRDGDLRFGSDDEARLGLESLRVELQLAASSAQWQLAAGGPRLGRINGRFALPLRRHEQQWQLADDAPWSGSLQLDNPTLNWIGPLIDPNISTAGHLQAQLQLAGSRQQPLLSGSFTGRDLQLRLIDQGLRLEHGQLDLTLHGQRVELTRLHWDSAIVQLPQEKRLPLAALQARPGQLRAEGHFDLAQQRGAINFALERLAVLQKPQQWLALSGRGQLGLHAPDAANATAGQATLNGEIVADAGFFGLPPADAPALGDDVRIKGRAPRPEPVMRLALNLGVDLGPALYFRGAGADSRLAGQLRLRNDTNGELRANGSVRTVDGQFDAYGTRLAIERGILNFQGLLDNPGLNIRAVRPHLPVEAGIAVTGTVRRPLVKLISDPEVPDSEKLSWMVLGSGPGAGAGAGAGALLSAATGLFGKEGGVTRQLMQTFGIDEFSLGSGSINGSGGGSSRVASSQRFHGATTSNGTLLRVGKRLADDLSLAVEHSMSRAESVVKLTWQWTPRVSLVGRAGSDNAVDLFYNVVFGKSGAAFLGQPPEKARAQARAQAKAQETRPRSGFAPAAAPAAP